MSKALQILTESTKKLLDEAGTKLANSMKSEKQAREFLSTLMQYRTDYVREMQRLMKEGLDAMTLGHYRAFIKSLDDAIQQANSSVHEQVKAVDYHQSDWKNQNIKIKSYETLTERRVQADRLHQSRIDQRQTDEISSQLRVRQNRQNDLRSPGF